MAATSSSAAVALASLPFPATTSSSRVSARSHRSSRSGRVVSTVRCTNASPNLSAGAPAAPPKPQIELEFVGPNPGADGSYPVDRAEAASGEKLLRDIMNENKIELYAAYGKVMNCGGGGSCGTCIVEILDGKELLNDRTGAENRYLKKIYGLHIKESGLILSHLAETGVMETSLSDNCGKQRKFGQGCCPTAAAVEEMIASHCARANDHQVV